MRRCERNKERVIFRVWRSLPGDDNLCSVNIYFKVLPGLVSFLSNIPAVRANAFPIKLKFDVTIYYFPPIWTRHLPRMTSPDRSPPAETLRVSGAAPTSVPWWGPGVIICVADEAEDGLPGSVPRNC